MTRFVRSVFVSDLHLGCRFAQADALLAFLNTCQPRFLYLVGDFVDGWRLRKGWYWNDSYSFLIRRLIELVKCGTIIRYTPGNHDEFPRHFIDSLGSVQIADEFVHLTADHRRLLVVHGDQFDAVVRNVRWLSLLGDAGYNVLLRLNPACNTLLRRFGCGHWSLSAFIKRQVKSAANFINRFEQVICKYAASRDCAGVICGHIHTPKITSHAGVQYFNTGDWVESCSVLVEYSDGSFELLQRPWRLDEGTPECWADEPEVFGYAEHHPDVAPWGSRQRMLGTR